MPGCGDPVNCLVMLTGLSGGDYACDRSRDDRMARVADASGQGMSGFRRGDGRFVQLLPQDECGGPGQMKSLAGEALGFWPIFPRREPWLP
jgi:hypothetical protein